MSFISSLASLVGGNSADTDRGKILESYGDLSNVFNYGMPQSKQQSAEGRGVTDTGLGELGDAGSYYRKILTGGREGALDAVAPTVNAANAGRDLAQRQISTFGTARGGGVNAVAQGLDTTANQTIDNAISSARPGAAQGEAAVGSATSNIGLSKVQQALQLLGISTGAAGKLGEMASANRPVSQGLHNAKANQVADVATGILDTLFTKFPGLGKVFSGGGGGGTTSTGTFDF